MICALCPAVASFNSYGEALDPVMDAGAPGFCLGCVVGLDSEVNKYPDSCEVMGPVKASHTAATAGLSDSVTLPAAAPVRGAEV